MEHTQPEKIKNDTIIMYGTPTCPMVPPMKQMLARADVHYEYVNLVGDLMARERVREINNGYESVPTFEFPDGSTLTEPSTGEMKRKLEQMGYDVPASAMLMGNLWLLVMAGGVSLALLRAFGIF
ncbi:MAG: glutaredoxin domain-containing protein [Chloroflexota bacterium]